MEMRMEVAACYIRHAPDEFKFKEVQTLQEKDKETCSKSHIIYYQHLFLLKQIINQYKYITYVCL